MPPLRRLNSMEQDTLTVKVASKTLKIACPAGEESALLAAGLEVTKRFKEINAKSHSNTSVEQTMVMTALNLANELLKTIDASEKERIALQSKVDLLQSTIEKALNVSALNKAKIKRK